MRVVDKLSGAQGFFDNWRARTILWSWGVTSVDLVTNCESFPVVSKRANQGRGSRATRPRSLTGLKKGRLEQQTWIVANRILRPKPGILAPQFRQSPPLILSAPICCNNEAQYHHQERPAGLPNTLRSSSRMTNLGTYNVNNPRSKPRVRIAATTVPSGHWGSLRRPPMNVGRILA